VQKRIISAAKRVECDSDRMPYIILRGRWCNFIVLKVHAPTRDKIDYVKDSFYEELERVLDKFPKIPFENFIAKVGKEDIFKPTIGNESLHKISNDNGVRLINFATSKNLTIKGRCSHIATNINILGHLKMGKLTIGLTKF
jgi:hypothetical protein